MVNRGNFKERDIVSIEDFSIEEINYILNLAGKIKANPKRFRECMKGKRMAPLFFEPSTRTSGSFQAAMVEMSGFPMDFDVYASSIKKGETLQDTLKTIERYHPDLIVMRHKRDGAARFGADVLGVPVINAGDGQNQHPTQTLLDLYTIKELRGSLNNINIAIAGDLKYGRTPHSLALALGGYDNCQMTFVSPETLKMPRDLLSKLNDREVDFCEVGLEKLEESINKTDLIYMTRVQRERFPEGRDGEYEYKKVSEEYCLTLDMLKNAGPDFKVLHPLPKISEIDDSVDKTQYAHYFDQLENGLYVRQALIYLVAGGKAKNE